MDVSLSTSGSRPIQIGSDRVPSPSTEDALPAVEKRTVASVSPSKGPIVIVTAGDDNYALPMAVTLSSALKHLPADRPAEIIVLDSGLSEENQTRLRRVLRQSHDRAELSVIRPDVSAIERVDLNMDRRFNASIFYRLLIPEVLSETYDRVLYLDSDLVVERNLEALWGQPLEGYALKAVPERIVSCPKAGVREWERLGLDEDSKYFNSGVMLINLERWREKDLHREVINYLLDPQNRFCYPSDQEALNAVLAGEWEALDLRWNVTHLLYSAEKRPSIEAMLRTDLDPIERDPFILHYTSEQKPWGPACNHPHEGRFHHYLRHSGWFSRGGYLAWRGTLAARRGIHRLKEATRPLRHRIGLKLRETGSLTDAAGGE